MTSAVEQSERQRFTYITAITTDDYLLGTLALNVSLKASGAGYKLVAVITENVSELTENILRCYGIDTLRVSTIELPASIHTVNRELRPHWTHSFGKLSIFSMSAFDKLVYVDSDMIILRNLDSLFAKPHMSAVVAGRNFPGNSNWSGLNSGLMVIKPQVGLYNDLVNCISQTARNLKEIGDQDVINDYFKWPQSSDLLLNESYNIFVPYIDYYINNRDVALDGQEIKVAHFIGSNKPWTMSLSAKMKHIGRLIMEKKKYEVVFFTAYLALTYAIGLHVGAKKLFGRIPQTSVRMSSP